MKKYTIAVVYHAMEIGGAEKELLSYMAHLRPEKYKIHLILTEKKGDLLPEIPHHVQVHIAPGNSFLPDIAHVYHLYMVLKSIHPDVVIGCMQDICFTILLIRSLGLLRYKTVISEQVVLSKWQQVKNTPRIKKLCIGYLYKKADMCLAQSESVLSDLVTKYGIAHDRARLMPSYVSMNTNRPLHVRAALETNRQPFFLYMGRLAPEKNIETLLAAFGKLRRRHKHIHLYVVGPGQTTEYDDICRHLGISQAVYFTGPTASPYEYYRNAVAIVIPSYVEGRCRVMIEAMIAKCPVISSDFPGHDRYIHHAHTGQVFHAESAPELEKRLTYALGNTKHLSSMASRAHDFIFRNYVRKQRRQHGKILNDAIQDVLRKGESE